MKKSHVWIGAFTALVLFTLGGKTAQADCVCLGESIPVGCSSPGGFKAFSWKPCNDGVTVCTFDSNTLNNYLISCCQNTGAGDNAGFANCMINNGGWFCGTCGS